MQCLPGERGASHRGAAAQLDRGGGLHVAPADGVPGRVADRHLVVWGREFEERRSESAVAVKKKAILFWRRDPPMRFISWV